MNQLPVGRWVKNLGVRKNKNGTLDILMPGKKKNPKKRATKKAKKKKPARRKSTAKKTKSAKKRSKR